MTPPADDCRLVLDRARCLLHDSAGRRFDPASRRWSPASTDPPPGTPVAGIEAARWLQRESGHALRVPVGVVGPRAASGSQLALAEAVGAGLAEIGLAVVCGGRQGVMEAACRGVASCGGVSIGLLPDPDPALANPHVGVVIATGIGEARNALIARASSCLVAIGDSYGTLSEVALGRQFGKTVIGLAGAANVAGVVHVDDVESALAIVAEVVLGIRDGG